MSCDTIIRCQSVVNAMSSIHFKGINYPVLTASDVLRDTLSLELWNPTNDKLLLEISFCEASGERLFSAFESKDIPLEVINELISIATTRLR